MEILPERTQIGVDLSLATTTELHLWLDHDYQRMFSTVRRWHQSDRTESRQYQNPDSCFPHKIFARSLAPLLNVLTN